MITRTKITLAILVIALLVILTGCMADNTPQFSITESAHEITVCSDTASTIEIESHVSNNYEYGESTGLIWQNSQNCVVYGK